MDTLTEEQRHYNMSRIRSRDTKQEVLVRKYLFGKGLRFRKNDKRLPGRPDIVLPKYRTAVFINGCFWHGHEGCKYFRMPATNTSFWKEKIKTNIERDKKDNETLSHMGWRVITVWECQLRPDNNEKTLTSLYEKIVSSGTK